MYRTFFVEEEYSISSMPSLTSRVASRIRGEQTIVDISNLRPQQVARLSGKFVLISTHKSYNYLHGTDKLPQVALGTKWIVLCIPHEKETRTHMSRFNRNSRRFVRRRHTSPVRLQYHPGSKCSIGNKRHSTPRAHSWCEVDDLIMAHLSVSFEMDLITNDRELRDFVRHRHPPPINSRMRDLMAHTKVTTLVLTSGGWEPAGR